MSITLSVTSFKEGPRKAQAVKRLGLALFRSGQRVLWVDLQPEATLTDALKVVPGEPPFESAGTVDELFMSRPSEEGTLRSRLVVTTGSGPDLVPAEAGIEGIGYHLARRTDRERILARFLEPLIPNYDWILIDSPTQDGILLQNCLTAASDVLFPVMPELFSVTDALQLRQWVELARSRGNPELRVAGAWSLDTDRTHILRPEAVRALDPEREAELLRAQDDDAAVRELLGRAKKVAGTA